MEQIKLLIEGAAECGVCVSHKQAEKMLTYMNLLLEKNKQINVTRITEPQEFIEKHLVDSLAVLKLIKEDAKYILDLGTGGGFPGVPLAIMLPSAQITMMDATGKKLKVIEELCSEIGIDNVEFLHGRAEDFGKDPAFREQYDCVVSRAVANMTLLAELALPLVKVGGCFLALKGKNYLEEMTIGEKAVEVLGGKIISVESYLLLQSQSVHVIIVVDKVKKTGASFPRSFSKIKKEAFPV